MIHIVSIYSSRKVKNENGYGFMKEDRVEISEADIEEWVMSQYRESNTLDEEREYKAEIESTTT